MTIAAAQLLLFSTKAILRQVRSRASRPRDGASDRLISAVQEQLGKHETGTDWEPSIEFDRAALTSLVSRIEVHQNRLIVSLKPTNQSTEPEILSISWQKPPSKRFRRILLPHGALRESVRPDRAERRARLVSAIARSRCWLDEIVTGSVIDAEELARRE